MSRRECPDIGADLLAAVSLSLAMLKTHLTSADPRVALRAASELTKLLAVCARHGIRVEEKAEDLTPRPPLRPGEGVFKAETLPDNPLRSPDTDNTDHSVQESTASPLDTPSPGRRGGGGVRSSPESFPAHVGAPPPDRKSPLPPGGKRLASFLGSPVGSVATTDSG